MTGFKHYWGNCCGQECPPGEECWVDDFDDYTEGESLEPYGYGPIIGVGQPPTSYQGGLLTHGPFQSPLIPVRGEAFRIFPYPPTTVNKIEFEVVLVALRNSGGGSGGGSQAPYPEVFTENVKLRIITPMTADIIYNDTSGTGTSTMITSSFSDGDVIKIVETVTNRNGLELTVDLSISNNGSSIFSYTGSKKTQTLSEWCGSVYGVNGHLTLTDDWSFHVNENYDCLEDCLFPDLFICPVDGFTFTVLDDPARESDGTLTHQVVVSCNDFPDSSDNFEVNIACDTEVCKFVDLLSINLICGSPGEIRVGNTSGCCPCTGGTGSRFTTHSEEFDDTTLSSPWAANTNDLTRVFGGFVNLQNEFPFGNMGAVTYSPEFEGQNLFVAQYRFKCEDWTGKPVHAGTGSTGNMSLFSSNFTSVFPTLGMTIVQRGGELPDFVYAIDDETDVTESGSLGFHILKLEVDFKDEVTRIYLDDTLKMTGEIYNPISCGAQLSLQISARNGGSFLNNYPTTPEQVWQLDRAQIDWFDR